MRKYVGTKGVKAEPCKAWKDAGGHKIGDDGYKVIYADGYESWSPKDVFESAYRAANDFPICCTALGMQSADYKERFKAEYWQLEIRIQKLEAMLEKYAAGTLNFKPSCSYDLLHEQLVHMQAYKRCLDERAKIEDVDLEFFFD